MQYGFRDQARVFKALCDESRLEILSLLRDGERCACVLLRQLDISQSTLSYHMKILCEAGIVLSRQEGKWTHYRLSREGAQAAMELLQALVTEGDLAAAPVPCSC